MNILFILPEYYPHPGGGLATYYLEIIPEIVRQGHQVKVIVGSGVVMGEQTYEVGQVSIEYLKPTLFKKYLDKYKKLSLFPELQKHLAAAWAMWEQANHGVSYDIVETTDWGLGFAPWIMNPEGPPVITTLHGSIGQIEYFEPRTGYEIHGDFVRMLELSCLRHIDLVFSYSSTNTRFWNDLTTKGITCLSPAYRVNIPDTFSLQAPPAVVGRIQYWKGSIVLCEAVNVLKKPPRIDWIGRDTIYAKNDQSMSEYLEEHYSGVWKKQVNPVGSVPYERVKQHMAHARFGIVPSVWDTFNYTCTEWMSHGKTVICSTGAGAHDLIDHGKNGFIFPSEDSLALAAIIEEVNQLPDARLIAIGKEARATVQDKLNPAAIATQRINHYKGLQQKTQITVPNEWIRNFVSPSVTGDNISGTLNHLPLKKISSYTLERTLRKLKPV